MAKRAATGEMMYAFDRHNSFAPHPTFSRVCVAQLPLLGGRAKANGGPETASKGRWRERCGPARFVVTLICPPPATHTHPGFVVCLLE